MLAHHYAHARVCVCVHTYTSMHACMSIHTHSHTRVREQVQECISCGAQTPTRMPAYIHQHAHILIHMDRHVYTHANMLTYISRSAPAMERIGTGGEGTSRLAERVSSPGELAALSHFFDAAHGLCGKTKKTDRDRDKHSQREAYD